MPVGVVLLSAGLDSTVNLYECERAGGVSLALTFDYGQKAAAQEIEKAKGQCQQLGIRHQVISLRWMDAFSKSTLIGSGQDIPSGKDVDISSLDVSRRTANSVWVPNRNGIFLNIAAGFAEQLGAKWVVPGFNLEEAQTFPDNSADFMRSLDQCLAYSTRSLVRVACWTTSLTKDQIVKRALDLGISWNFVWPCYLADSEPCGRCESCQRFRRAVHQVPGAVDVVRGQSEWLSFF